MTRTQLASNAGGKFKRARWSQVRNGDNFIILINSHMMKIRMAHSAAHNPVSLRKLN